MRHAALRRDLRRWRTAGIITEEQAEAIARLEAPLDSPRRLRTRTGAVAEIVGYVGAILAVVGLGLIVARSWADLHTPLRLTGSAALAMALGLGGGWVHETAAAQRRLRWFLWLASTAATGLFVAVGTRALGSAPPSTEAVVLATSVAVGVQAGALWRGRFRPVQELTTLGAGVVALGAVSRLVGSPAWMAVGVWLGAISLLALGLSRRIATRVVAETTGAVALGVAIVMFLNFSRGPGGLLGVASASALLAAAALPEQIPTRREARALAITGVLGLALALPSVLSYFAERAGLVTGGLVWLVGASVLLIGLTVPLRGGRLARAAGSLATLGGAALVAAQYPNRAPIIGLVTAVGLLVLGARPGELGETAVGALGLLVNVPWLIVRLFPGQVRAPLVTLVTGALLVGLAVVWARERTHTPHGRSPGGRLRR